MMLLLLFVLWALVRFFRLMKNKELCVNNRIPVKTNTNCFFQCFQSVLFIVKPIISALPLWLRMHQVTSKKQANVHKLILLEFASLLRNEKPSSVA